MFWKTVANFACELAAHVNQMGTLTVSSSELEKPAVALEDVSYRKMIKK